ncbi:MAG TPA: methyltransferase domain-containing protein [Pyrinomonadaceae bacterium]|jgi:SAM-dependent methyltransferase
MDPELEEYRKVVRDEWTNDDTVTAWARWHAKITEQQVNMREALIQHARLEPGMRVLDLACGTGDPALEIARRVGPSGHVTATDLSPQMVDECRKNASAAGIANMDFATADAENLQFGPECFDRVTSRLGAMYFVDVQRALAEIKRVLVTGGIVTLQVWGPPDESPYFMNAVGPFARRLSPPPPPADAPTPVRFAPPGKLADALAAAGFFDTREDRRSMVLPWPGSPNELWQHLYDIAIPLRPLFDGLSGDERSAAIGESVAGYAKYYDGKTVNVPASIVTVSART